VLKEILPFTKLCRSGAAEQVLFFACAVGCLTSSLNVMAAAPEKAAAGEKAAVAAAGKAAPAGGKAAPAGGKAAPAGANGGPQKSLAARTQHKIMVPPPPPEIPLVGGEGERLFSTLGVPLQYLSRSDLANMESRLVANRDKLEKEKSDREHELQEKQTRADKFEELYKEGVVSRRELENAKKELCELKDKSPDLEQRLQDVEDDLSRVRKQMASIDKRNNPKRTTAGKQASKSPTASAPSASKAASQNN
jgi:hypothetical protein